MTADILPLPKRDIGPRVERRVRTFRPPKFVRGRTNHVEQDNYTVRYKGHSFWLRRVDDAWRCYHHIPGPRPCPYDIHAMPPWRHGSTSPGVGYFPDFETAKAAILGTCSAVNSGVSVASFSEPERADVQADERSADELRVKLIRHVAGMNEDELLEALLFLIEHSDD